MIDWFAPLSLACPGCCCYISLIALIDFFSINYWRHLIASNSRPFVLLCMELWLLGLLHIDKQLGELLCRKSRYSNSALKSKIRKLRALPHPLFFLSIPMQQLSISLFSPNLPHCSRLPLFASAHYIHITLHSLLSSDLSHMTWLAGFHCVLVKPK